MSDEEKEYNALLIDTSIYVANGLRLEKGLLGKLHQFEKSPIELLIPDVIRNEVLSHLEKKIKVSRNDLEKSLNDAGDYLFFDGSSLSDAKKILIDSKEIDGLAEDRVSQFIDNTGALVLECGDFVTVTELLSQYFSNTPPFAESGKKKNEFPDAIVLLAVEEWAKREGKSVLAIARDDDWKKYCELSERIDYQEDFSAGLAVFHRATAPYALLANLITSIKDDEASPFLSAISAGLTSALDRFTPDQEADSHLYWEPEGSTVWFEGYELLDDEFRVIDSDEDWVVLEAFVSIKVGAEGEFSLSMYDSIDKDHVYMGSVSVETTNEFESEILITVTGDLDGPIDALEVDEVEIASPIGSIDYGTIEPDYGEYY
ncbi:PIN domain-containing protein [Halomonas litopenaei]|uniref:PIN domain-containing protein n=1 Tax=Halomonas litopenaei TaxID=2109328 RepID=UPI003FA16CC6